MELAFTAVSTTAVSFGDEFGGDDIEAVALLLLLSGPTRLPQKCVFDGGLPPLCHDFNNTLLIRSIIIV